MLNKLTDLKNNWFFIFFAIILAFTPLFRLSWDLGTLTVIHLLSLAAFLFFLSSYTPLRLSTDEILYALFFLAASASLLGNGEKGNIRDSLYVLLDGLFAAFLWQYVPLKDKKRLLIIPPVIGFFFSVIILYLNLKNPGLFFSALPPKEIFVNPNALAAYLVIALPLSFRLWFGKGKGPVVLSLFIFAGIVLTRSRWAVAAASLSVITYMLMTKSRYWIPASIIALAAAVTAVPALTSMKLEQYFAEQSGFLGNRIAWWTGAWNMFVHNPFNGVGWGNFGGYYPFYKEFPGLNTLFAHNIFLQMLAEAGFVAPAVFTLIAASAGAGYVRHYSATSLSKHYYTPVFIAAAAFLLLNFMDYGFYVPALSILFWILLASFNDRALTVRRKPMPGTALVLPVFVIISLSMLLPLSSAIHVSAANRSLKEHKLLEAERNARHAVIADPLRSDARAKLAEVYFARYTETKIPEFLSLAVDSQRSALDRFPESAAYWNDLAWLLWTSGDASGATEAAKKAVDYNRFNAKYAENLKYFAHAK